MDIWRFWPFVIKCSNAIGVEAILEEYQNKSGEKADLGQVP